MQLYDFKRKYDIKKFIRHYVREQSVLRASEEFDCWSKQRQIEQLLKQLAVKYPTSECSIVIQLVLQGYTIEEVAEKIERSSIAVRVLLHKCREKLKQLNME
jgi:DNA-directed RNA polymerase specialized sigma24 family protein